MTQDADVGKLKEQFEELNSRSETATDHEETVAVARNMTARVLDNASRRVVSGPGDF